MLLLRTRRRFYQSRPGTLLLATSAITGVASLALVLTPISGDLGFVSPSFEVLLAMGAILAGYVLVTETAKSWVYSMLLGRHSSL